MKARWNMKIILSAVFIVFMIGTVPAQAQINAQAAADTIGQINQELLAAESEAATSGATATAPATTGTPAPAMSGGQAAGVAVPPATTPNVAVKAIPPLSVQSLLFNFWEQTALLEAKRSAESSGLTRGVTEGEIASALNMDAMGERKKPPPEERDIALGGIVYTSQKDWTIWLNGQRITPDALPKEVIDLKVYRHHVDMKWLDEYTLVLYPIRLRPHQRFNLDTRIFQPG